MNDNIKNFIKQEAYKLGFAKVGISLPEKINGGYLEYWINSGFNADMKWFNNNKNIRLNPYKIFHNVRSIVSLAMGYYTGDVYPFNNKLGYIARYAWGLDYHIVMKNQLRKLLNTIRNNFNNIDGKIFVDTAPIMEKYWAIQSGIGWMGKNTLIITEEYGSWVFLGELLLNIEMVPDIPITNKCGFCDNCIRCCPTGSLIKPYVLNASECIAYLTVHKNDFLSKLSINRLKYIWGCDICQEVCPWNHENIKTSDLFTAQKEKLTFDFDLLNKIDNIELKKRLKNTCLRTSTKEQLIRNCEKATKGAYIGIGTPEQPTRLQSSW